MLTQTTLVIIGCIATLALYSFSPFFRARKAALLLFFFGWTIFIAGVFGTALYQPLPLWVWLMNTGMLTAFILGIRSEYKLWRKYKK